MSAKKNDVVTVAGTEYHVTRVGPPGVYGHETSRCNEAGCAGDERHLGAEGYVRLADGSYLVQLLAENQWGFELADDDQSWEGGIGCGSESWELVPASQVPAEDLERLSYLVD